MSSKKTAYNNAPGLLYWQGIRYLSDNFYITCGTYNDETGVLNVGPIDIYNPSNNYAVNYPGSNITSVYGPDYIGGGIYRLVGSYRKNNDNVVYGFFYQGSLFDLQSDANYKTIVSGGNFTYVHSIMGDVLVGNYDNISQHNTHGLPFGPINAFLMNINNGKRINIIYPGSTSNTVYGVWHNGGSSYTLCGGYSNDAVSITDVYKNGQPKPIGNAYIVNYDIETDIFSNWTSINYPNSSNKVTHFQGISKNGNNYQLAGDTIDTISITKIASYVIVSNDYVNNFRVNTWTDIKYPLPGTITSANSVANNIVVGTYINKDDVSIAYQVEILQ
jgi:hypothetical protein